MDHIEACSATKTNRLTGLCLGCRRSAAREEVLLVAKSRAQAGQNLYHLTDCVWLQDNEYQAYSLALAAETISSLKRELQAKANEAESWKGQAIYWEGWACHLERLREAGLGKLEEDDPLGWSVGKYAWMLEPLRSVPDVCPVCHPSHLLVMVFTVFASISRGLSLSCLQNLSRVEVSIPAGPVLSLPVKRFWGWR